MAASMKLTTKDAQRTLHFVFSRNYDVCGGMGDATSHFKSTFITALIKQEKLVFTLVIFIHSEVFMCYYKSVYGYPGIQRVPISGIRFSKEPKNAQP